ncbi:MAG: tRNA modification GTPase MnmE [Phycisphaerae bacterium]|nr:MAG: tRNA modification GTPase MnmE [Phycisphaerae bacterium]
MASAMIAGDTIVACSSPPGASRRALVRLSGPAVPALADTLLLGCPPVRGCGPARVCLDGDGPTLPVLVARYPSPASYTGEDVLEIVLPGNPTLVERVVGRLARHPGVRRAEPGEFSARAYLHGRLTLTQAEGVAATIAATSTEQLAAARALLEGRAGQDYQAWADELSALLALVEAGIDFTDQEDVRAIEPGTLRRRARAVRDAVIAHLGVAHGQAVESAEPRVVLAGRPNAGKSTLFNALLGRVRAVESPRAGTTRDVLEEPLDLSGDAPGAGVVTLADAAGLDAAETTASGRGAQAAARAALAQADVVLWCDPAGRFDPADCPPTRGVVLRVRTFADQGGPARDATLAVCAIDGWNLDHLRRAIASALHGSTRAPLAELLPRHRAAMKACVLALDTVLGQVPEHADGLDHAEEIAHALRSALDAAGELVGRIDPDDVLGKVFASFCIGK